MPDFKLFTLAEAERTLPLVRRIVQDLTAEYPAWREAVGRFEILTGGARADWGETQELVAARDVVTEHAERINRYLQELEGYTLRMDLDPGDSHIRPVITVIDEDRRVVGFISHPEQIPGITIVPA